MEQTPCFVRCPCRLLVGSDLEVEELKYMVGDRCRVLDGKVGRQQKFHGNRLRCPLL